MSGTRDRDQYICLLFPRNYLKKNTSTWWLHFHQNDRTHNSEMPFYHKTHTCWINYNHKHLNSLLSPQESAKDPKSPLYQELAWESEEEGGSPLMGQEKLLPPWFILMQKTPLSCADIKRYNMQQNQAPVQTLIWYDILVLLWKTSLRHS